MTDVASLSFNIDSSDAQRAIAVLETLKASSISVSQAAATQTQTTTNLTQAYNQQRDQLSKLVEQTKTWDGTLQGLVGRLDQMRRVMTDSHAALTSYAQVLQQTNAVATSLNGSVEGLDRYATRARQLSLVNADLATGYEKITAALKAQTVAGDQARQMLANFGVRTVDLNTHQADIVLQRFVEQLRGHQITGNTVQMAQQVFGPGMDAQQLMGMVNAPYQTMYARETEQRRLGAQTQIDTQSIQVQQLSAELTRNAARLADLSGRYTVNPSTAGRLGFSLGGLLRPDDQVRQQLEEINRMPADQRQNYERLPYRVQRQITESYPAQVVRNFTSGTFGANQSEIEVRAQAEMASGNWLSAFFRAQARELQNAAGSYKPMLTQETRTLSEGEQRYLREQSAGIIAQYGDTSLQGSVASAERLRQFREDPDMRNRYRAGFGEAEGDRRRANQQATLQMGADYAARPEQQVTDDAKREAVLMALPPEQRARVRYQLQFMGSQPGLAAVPRSFTPGTSAAAILGSSALSDSQRQAADTGFGQQVGDQMQLQHEDAVKQIHLQDQLTAAMKNGKAAAEDTLQIQNVLNQARLAGASVTDQLRAAQDALTAREAQRTTQASGQATDLERENHYTRERLALIEQLNHEGATAERRQAALRRLTEDQSITRGQDSGSLPKGWSPEAQAEIERVRQAQRARTPMLEAFDEAQAGGRQQLSDTRRVTDLMQSNHLTLGQATREYENQQRLTQAITEAQTRQSDALAHGQEAAAAQAEAEVKRLETLRAETSELQRQNEIQEQIQRNIETGQQAGQQFMQTGAQFALPPSQRGLVAPLGNLYFPNVQAGLQRLTPDVREREQALRERLQHDLGLTPAAAAGLGAHAVGESGVQSIEEKNPPAGSRGGVGFIQWTGSRRDQYMAFAKEHKLDPYAAETSTQFLEYDLKTNHPQVLEQLKQPGVTPAQAAQIAAPYVWGSDPRLNANLPVRQAQAEALAGNAPGGVSPAQQDAFINLVQDLANGREPQRPPDVPPEQWQSMLTAAHQMVLNQRQTQQGRVLETGEQILPQMAAAQERLRLVGRPGDQQRIIPSDPTLPPDLDATRRALQQQPVIAGQQVHQAEIEEASRKNIDTLSQLADAYGKDKAAVDEVTARQQAHNEALQAGTGIVNEEARARQILTEQFAQERVQLARRNLQQGDQQEVQRALNARGASSDPLDQADTRRRVEMEQYFREHPGTENTPEGQKKRDQVEGQKTLDQQTQAMGELRDMTHQAEGAFEHAFEALATHSGNAKDVLMQLGSELEHIALRALVIKPLEHALNQLMGGGDDKDGGGGGGGGHGGGGGPTSVWGALGHLFGVGGGGGGGGGAPGIISADRGGMANQQFGNALVDKLIKTTGGPWNVTQDPSSGMPGGNWTATPAPTTATNLNAPTAPGGGNFVPSNPAMQGLTPAQIIQQEHDAHERVLGGQRSDIGSPGTGDATPDGGNQSFNPTGIAATSVGDNLTTAYYEYRRQSAASGDAGKPGSFGPVASAAFPSGTTPDPGGGGGGGGGGSGGGGGGWNATGTWTGDPALARATADDSAAGARGSGGAAPILSTVNNALGLLSHLFGDGTKDLGNGMFHVPGTGVTRGRDGNIYPNVAMRGGDGRLYVNPPGYDLQFMDKLMQNMRPNDNSGVQSADLVGYKAGTYDIPGVGKVTISPEAAAHAVVHVNDPGTSQFNWAAYAIDPRLTNRNEPNLMPGARTTAENYNAAVNWYNKDRKAWWTVPEGENYLHTAGYRPGWAADTNDQSGPPAATVTDQAMGVGERLAAAFPTGNAGDTGAPSNAPSPGDGSDVGLGGQLQRAFPAVIAGDSGGVSAASDSGTDAAPHDQWNVNKTQWGGSQGSAGDSQGSFGDTLAKVFGHAGGLTGYLVDQIGGEGFYKGGGLIGQMWRQYQGSQDLKAPGDTTFGGTGGSGGAADTGYVTPPIPPDQAPGAIADTSALADSASTATDSFAGLTDTLSSSVDAFAAKGLAAVSRPSPHLGGYRSLADFESQIVVAPTMFRFARGASFGMMGEAGPEAILPLQRSADGRLGVASSGGSQTSGHTINFNIHTPDANSFRLTQSQLQSRAAAQLAHVQQRNTPA